MVLKHTDASVKKSFWAQWPVKKIMLVIFWDMKRRITIDFFEKGATVNNASQC